MSGKSFVLTEPTSVTFVYAWGAVVVDKNSGEVKGIYPDKGEPIYPESDGLTFPHPKAVSEALESAVAILLETRHIRGAEELHQDAAKFVTALVKTTAAHAKAMTAPS